MNFEIIKNKIGHEAKNFGFTDWEVALSISNDTSIVVRNSDIDNFENNIQMCISFRGNIYNKTGYSYSEKVDTESIKYLLENAVENAQIIEDDAEVFFDGNDDYPDVKSYCSELDELKIYDIINNALDMEKSLLNYSEYIKMVDYCMFSKSSSELFMANSKGMDISFKQNMAIAYMRGIAQKYDDIKTGSNYWYGNNINKFSAKKLGEELGKKIISHIGAGTIKSNTINVIFENEAMSDILATFCGIFFAENVQKGFSMLKNKIDTAIASDILTIKDDGICEQSGYSIPFDSEGVPIKNKYVIKKGNLKSLLYNIKSSLKDNVKSTGNGFRSSLKSPIKTACTNFYIEKGDITRCELFENVGNGILITSVSGLHSGANTISGDFSLLAEGFLLESGKISKPVEQITVAGNFYDVIKNIKYIADDLKFNIPTSVGNFGSPTVFVGEMAISGL